MLQHLDSHLTKPSNWEEDAMKSLGALGMDPCPTHVHPKHPSETDPLVPLLTSRAEPTADCWRAKRLLFLFLIEVFQKEGVCITHVTLQVPFQKKNKTNGLWFC